jgi:hypothetical protein
MKRRKRPVARWGAAFQLPGQEFVDPGDRMVGDLGEDGAEIGFGIDTVSLAVSVSDRMPAARSSPLSEPANSQFLRPSAMGRIARSAALLCR